MTRRAEVQRKKLGVIVNPVAGMGGRVGLKGTDGADIVKRARSMGASSESPGRTAEALAVIAPLRSRIETYSYPGEMGEDLLKRAGFEPRVMGSIRRGRTTSSDTERAAREMTTLGVDLLLFAGGDGTARDIYRAVGNSVTVLGIPAGVKMHSAVFALSPRVAGDVASDFLRTARSNFSEAEVMDIDEASFRKGVLNARLYGYLRVPQERHRQLLQSAKSGGTNTEKQVAQGIATELFRTMEKGRLYLFGPGSTTRDVLSELHLDKTLLGVDVVQDGRVIAKDVNERRLEEIIGEDVPAKVVVTPIGGQGFVFGRGNQQLSSKIIKKVGKENLIVVASKRKLASLGGRPLLVDTGDPAVDSSLRGYIRIIVGAGDYVVYKIGD